MRNILLIAFALLSSFVNAQTFDAATSKHIQTKNAKSELEKLLTSGISKQEKAQVYFYLTQYDTYDKARQMELATKGLNLLPPQQITPLHCDLLKVQLDVKTRDGVNEESLGLAHQLLEKSKTAHSEINQAHAHNVIGMYYVNEGTPEDILKANEHLTRAYNLSNKPEYIAENTLIAANFAELLWANDKTLQAKMLVGQLIRNKHQVKDYNGTQYLANSLGQKMLETKDYNGAINMLKRATSVTEKQLENQNAAERLETLDRHSQAYTGLIRAYLRKKNIFGLFEAQDLNRSRLLRSKLNNTKTAISIPKVQSLLKENEAMLCYSEGLPGQTIVSVITKNDKYIRASHNVDAWLRLKKDYANRVNKVPNSINGYVTKLNEFIKDGRIYYYTDKKDAFKPEDYEDIVEITRAMLQSDKPEQKAIQTRLLKHWYNLLIANLSLPKNINALIISGEGSLNLLPFEAFMRYDGKYLIELYDIQYTPSATIWASLKDRNYTEPRKELLAFGGATYQPKSKNGSVNSSQNLFSIQNSISEKIKANNNNLSDELKSLGFGGADYLPGTLKEVQNLKTIIPTAKVYTDVDMTESLFKKLNTSGELSQYKYLHLATHGFAFSAIPQISGLMMTQPAAGDAPEDMFLLSHEIEKLQLKADVAILSACETALGKTYGGEGINGLNSALLIAGANNTLLSLWPVNDAGTMIFMTELYNNLYNGQMTVANATNAAKRKMLSGAYGKQMASPVIWAPFVLNGR